MTTEPCPIIYTIGGILLYLCLSGVGIALVYEWFTTYRGEL